MRITELQIRNFRSIKSLDLTLGSTTLLIGANNSGKTAILDALRLVLDRRWQRFATRFHEDDVHRTDPSADPRKSPPVSITIRAVESDQGRWAEDIHIALDEVIVDLPSGQSAIIMRVRVPWSEEKMEFQPTWEFLNSEDSTLSLSSNKVQAALRTFDEFLPSFSVPALRDPRSQFNLRSSHWMRLLNSIRFSTDFEQNLIADMAAIDETVFQADERFEKLIKTLGRATKVVLAGGPGAARLSAMPVSIDELLQRTTVIMRNQESQPWLPLARHGQGLQSMAVLFLFQLALLETVQSKGRRSARGFITIEEPEAHLHPQAIRSLREQLAELDSQQVISSHSPVMVQAVNLTDLRIVRLGPNGTECHSLRPRHSSEIPWNAAFGRIREKNEKRKLQIFETDESGFTSAVSSFSKRVQEKLKDLTMQVGGSTDEGEVNDRVLAFWRESRTLIHRVELQSHQLVGNVVLGEALFASKWILVEGPTDQSLVVAIAKCLGRSLDRYNVSVVAFQDEGIPASIPVGLASSFGIDWRLVIDNDSGGTDVLNHLEQRGFSREELGGNVFQHEHGDLERELVFGSKDQLFNELNEILDEDSESVSGIRARDAIVRMLGARKRTYVPRLVERLDSKPCLAHQMPKQFLRAIEELTKSDDYSA